MVAEFNLLGGLVRRQVTATAASPYASWPVRCSINAARHFLGWSSVPGLAAGSWHLALGNRDHRCIGARPNTIN